MQDRSSEVAWDALLRDERFVDELFGAGSDKAGSHGAGSDRHKPPAAAASAPVFGEWTPSGWAAVDLDAGTADGRRCRTRR